ncbi:hypothetical protein [uncultured Alistipes sp.]|uniref:hypothetical protein n=1 Tax=uncultured Alistipes sp. TaxID=538949 RepID=UPI0032205E3D
MLVPIILYSLRSSQVFFTRFSQPHELRGEEIFDFIGRPASAAHFDSRSSPAAAKRKTEHSEVNFVLGKQIFLVNKKSALYDLRLRRQRERPSTARSISFLQTNISR